MTFKQATAAMLWNLCTATTCAFLYESKEYNLAIAAGYIGGMLAEKLMRIR